MPASNPSKIRENLRKRLAAPRIAEAQLRRSLSAMGESFERFNSNVSLVKGDPGAPGKDADEEEIIRRVSEMIRVPEDGHTPSPAELRSLILPLIPAPVPGPEGAPGTGEKGDPGYSPREGLDYLDVRKHPDHVAWIIAKNSKSIAPSIIRHLDPSHIASMLSKIDFKSPEGKKLKSFFASGGFNMDDQRWHGAGGSGSSQGIAVSNEIVSGAGTSWSLASVPKLGTQHVYAEGQRLTPGAGNDYVITAGAITTSNSYPAGSVLADYSK